MPKTTFEIKTYSITLAREHNATADGVNIKFPAYILCEGDTNYVVIYVLDDTSPVPANSHLPGTKHGNIFVPRWQYEWFIDLLRNEKPVFCTLNSDKPKWNELYSGKEPVGEIEIA